MSCTGKDICNLSGISAASFSRYRNGERVPELGTKPFEDLCCALAQISAQKGKLQITADAVKKAFVSCDDFVSTDKELLRKISTHFSLHSMSILHSCVSTQIMMRLPFFAFVTAQESPEMPSGLHLRLLPLLQEQCRRSPKSVPLQN